MAITLSPALESRIERIVATQGYGSAEVLLDTALDTLEETPVLTTEQLQEAVDEGLWSAENEPLVSEEQLLEYMGQVRDELRRG